MLSIYSFSLPFKEPFQTPVTTIRERRGLILRAGNHYAEASPLPGFSPETVEHAAEALQAGKEKLDQFFDSSFDYGDLDNLVREYGLMPSLQFALSMLGFKILHQRGVAPREVSALFEADPAGVQVNEVAGTGTGTAQAAALAENGAAVIKFKTEKNPEVTAELLHSLHRQFPRLQFRLDANQSWPAEKVKHYSSLFRALPVQFIEEPSAFSNEKELQTLLDHCAIPVALDESVQTLTRFRRYSKLFGEKIAAFVIKPTFFGNLPGLFETIGQQNALVDKVIFTSAFESAAGLRDIRCIAAAYGAKSQAHGLGTARFFTADLCSTEPRNFHDLHSELLTSIGQKS